MNNTITTKYKAYYVVAKWNDADGNPLFTTSKFYHKKKAEKFVKEAVKKSDARPFKVSKGITMMVIDPLTGQKAKFSSTKTILEAYKSKNVVEGKILYSNNDRLGANNILRFY